MSLLRSRPIERISFLGPLVQPQGFTPNPAQFWVEINRPSVSSAGAKAPMPGGIFKVKTYRELRDRERDRRVPVLKIGSLYFIWWPSQQRAKKG
ncbi:hypothetical protein [Mesorhizobium sp. INR15]|uniref:hypothetical protein n=1 Tax=Mesorhizobium sp. INR15 TaxID=2654248 RepID=UPI00189673B5|nr:hypothetical protein [Mesorhizobium sp. INR15]QPC95953.1 hypothetical protein GA829_36205 [Mesorhizobium sp. INR15]